jgi:hypothetical protein
MFLWKKCKQAIKSGSKIPLTYVCCPVRNLQKLHAISFNKWAAETWGKILGSKTNANIYLYISLGLGEFCDIYVGKNKQPAQKKNTGFIDYVPRRYSVKKTHQSIVKSILENLFNFTIIS